MNVVRGDSLGNDVDRKVIHLESLWSKKLNKHSIFYDLLMENLSFHSRFSNNKKTISSH